MIIIASLVISFFIVMFIRFCMHNHEKDCVESMENFLDAIKMFSRMEEPIDKNSYLRIGKYIEKVHKLSSGTRSCHVKFLAIKMREEYDKLKVKGE